MMIPNDELYRNTHKIILIGEIHPWSSRYILGEYNKKVDKEIEEEQNLVKKERPTYLFLEHTEKDFDDPRFYRTGIIKVAKKIGTEIIPMEDTYPNAETNILIKSIRMPDRRRAKMVPIRKIIRYCKRFVERYKKITGEMPDHELIEYSEKMVRYLENQLKEIERRFKEYTDFEKILFEEDDYIRGEFREEKMAKVISKYYTYNPKAKLMVIVRSSHIKEDSKLIEDLRKSGAPLEIINVGKQSGLE